MIAKVKAARSAEQWADLADASQDKTWFVKKKQKASCNILGLEYKYYITDSKWDGWAGYLFCSPLCWTETPPALGEDLTFI